MDYETNIAVPCSKLGTGTGIWVIEGKWLAPFRSPRLIFFIFSQIHLPVVQFVATALHLDGVY